MSRVSADESMAGNHECTDGSAGNGRRLALLVCAASPARHAGQYASRLRSAGWQVSVVASPAAVEWLDQELPDETGSGWSDASDALARPHAVLVAPATFHTLNRCAAGLNDTLLLSVLHEAIGSGIPVIVAPHVNHALAAHPALERSRRTLMAWGVRVVQDVPCEGGCGPDTHWPAIDAALREHATAPGSGR
jgi:phosphopantothenoylcysteine synthetase/decarboxylase